VLVVARVVVIRLRVPEWVGDEDIERVVREIEEKLESSVPASTLRRILGVKEEDLVDRLEPIGWRGLEDREKERLKRLYGA
jgi:hypothetical protein